jgi:hypothetical protein
VPGRRRWCCPNCRLVTASSFAGLAIPRNRRKLVVRSVLGKARPHVPPREPGDGRRSHPPGCRPFYFGNKRVRFEFPGLPVSSSVNLQDGGLESSPLLFPRARQASESLTQAIIAR